MSDITRILQHIEAGEPEARDSLFEAVYVELRQMASAQLAREQPGQTLQPTALVHEAWLRLKKSQDAAPKNNPPAPLGDSRHYFFAAAAEAMRRILIERARSRHAHKRGGGRQKVDLELLTISMDDSLDQVLDVDAALKQLAIIEPQAAELVTLRYFAGFSVEEASEMLGMSLRSTHRLWGYAKAWLYEALRQGEKITEE